MLVKTTDFYGEIAISMSASDDTMAENLCFNIREYEPLFMRYTLGVDLYALIPDWDDGALAQRFVDIRDGVTYTVDNRTYKFDGIKRLAARYIYSFHIEQLHQSTTPVGVKKERAANSVDTGLDKSCRQWNKMSNEVLGLLHMLEYRVDGSGDKVYPEFDKCQTEYWRLRPKNLLGI